MFLMRVLAEQPRGSQETQCQDIRENGTDRLNGLSEGGIPNVFPPLVIVFPFGQFGIVDEGELLLFQAG